MKENILDGLPQKLKSLKVYESVEKRIGEIMRSDHKHTKVGAFIKCKQCAPKMNERQEYLKSIGFASYHQYLKWRQVMDIMKQLKDEKTKTKAK